MTPNSGAAPDRSLRWWRVSAGVVERTDEPLVGRNDEQVEKLEQSLSPEELTQVRFQELDGVWDAQVEELGPAKGYSRFAPPSHLHGAPATLATLPSRVTTAGASGPLRCASGLSDAQRSRAHH